MCLLITRGKLLQSELVTCCGQQGLGVARSRSFLGGVGFLTTLGVGVGFFYSTPTPEVQLDRFNTTLLTVVCLREASEALASDPPFLGAPFRWYAHKFFLFLVKNLLFTHIMCYKTDHKQVLYFQGAPFRNCNVQVLCFQRGPQKPLKCVSTLLLNFIERAPKRNCSV